MKHTKGPWYVQDPTLHKINGDTAIAIAALEESNDYVAFIRNENTGCAEIDKDTRFANAQLIAAAPDLLEALEIAKETIEHFVQVTGQNFDSTLRVINNTIAKATGEKGGIL